MNAPTVWRGQTMADRAGDRRAQLIDAGFDILGTDGAAAATVREICRRANLSRKYFYENFNSREDLILAVYHQTIDGLRDAVTSTPATGDVRERLRAVFDAATTYFVDDPRRVRVAFRETLADATLLDEAATVVPAFMLAVGGHLSDVVPELASRQGADPGLTVSSLSGGFVMVYLNWLEGRIVATREEVAEHCVALTLSALTAATHRG